MGPLCCFCNQYSLFRRRATIKSRAFNYFLVSTSKLLECLAPITFIISK